MELDLFTIIAQIVNFLVLLFLLRAFLYKRVVAAMDEREATIQSRWKEAERNQEAAERDAEHYAEKRRSIEEERTQVLEEARQQAQEERNRRLQEARKTVDTQRAEWMEQLEREKQDVLRDIRRQVGTEVFQVSKHVLSDLANEDVHARVVDVFVKRVNEEGSEAARRLDDILRDSTGPLEVRTSIPLSEEQRKRVEKIVARFSDGTRTPTFRESEDILCGIEVHADGTVVSYGLGDYLDGVEARMGELLSSR
jgi:F-type H+-transporting ATPase subunit b